MWVYLGRDRAREDLFVPLGRCTVIFSLEEDSFSYVKPDKQLVQKKGGVTVALHTAAFLRKHCNV
jgi:hypothetical protein